jgi:hypothetical protein
MQPTCAGATRSTWPGWRSRAARPRGVRADLRAHKASKDLSVRRAQSESRGRPALRDHKDQSVRRGRREMRAAKARSDPPASADHQGRKAPLAHPGPQDQLARRVTPARRRQFASSLVRIPLPAETTKSWPVSFVQAARPTERSARPLERQQLVYAYVGERVIRSAYLAFVIFSRSGAARDRLQPRGFHRKRISASTMTAALAAAKMAANKKSA